MGRACSGDLLDGHGDNGQASTAYDLANGIAVSSSWRAAGTGDFDGNWRERHSLD
jgi:hypothetical protein